MQFTKLFEKLLEFFFFKILELGAEISFWERFNQIGAAETRKYFFKPLGTRRGRGLLGCGYDKKKATENPLLSLHLNAPVTLIKNLPFFFSFVPKV